MCYEVTIGIPVYKAVDYIEKTMESALNQTYESIEYLVIDDCGDDGSIAIVEQYKAEHPRGKDICIIHNNRNEGVGASRNHIIDESHGYYLYFLDSDDYIEPDTIELLVDSSKKNDADVVYGSLDRIDLVNNTPTRSMMLPNIKMLSEGELALYAFKNYNTFQISVCNCLMKLNLIKSNGLRFIDSAFWEDMAFTYELVTVVNRAVFIPNVTYHYQCRPGSLSHYQNREYFDKVEIMNNVATIDYLKVFCLKHMDNKYLPYLCYNIEMNSFYIICYILNNYKNINPSITWRELKAIMHHPISFCKIIQFRNKLFSNVLLKIIGLLPKFLFVPIIFLIGKIKSAI